nr:uncharacterized protein LOC129057548 [Pongo abelii]
MPPGGGGKASSPPLGLRGRRAPVRLAWPGFCSPGRVFPCPVFRGGPVELLAPTFGFVLGAGIAKCQNIATIPAAWRVCKGCPGQEAGARGLRPVGGGSSRTARGVAVGVGVGVGVATRAAAAAVLPVEPGLVSPPPPRPGSVNRA